MAKHYSIDQLSNASMRQAQNQNAILQRDINKLRDSISGLSRSLHTPVIKTPRGVIKASRSSLNPLLRAEVASLTRYAISSYTSDNSDSQDDGTDSTDTNDTSADDNYTSNATNRFYRSQSQIAGRALGSLISGQRIR